MVWTKWKQQKDFYNGQKIGGGDTVKRMRKRGQFVKLKIAYNNALVSCFPTGHREQSGKVNEGMWDTTLNKNWGA